MKVDVVAKHESWFGPKRVRVDWGPHTWQGWLNVALFTVVVAGFAVFQSSLRHPRVLEGRASGGITVRRLLRAHERDQR